MHKNNKEKLVFTLPEGWDNRTVLPSIDPKTWDVNSVTRLEGEQFNLQDVVGGAVKLTEDTSAEELDDTEELILLEDDSTEWEINITDEELEEYLDELESDLYVEEVTDLEKELEELEEENEELRAELRFMRKQEKQTLDLLLGEKEIDDGLLYGINGVVKEVLEELRSDEYYDGEDDDELVPYEIPSGQLKLIEAEHMLRIQNIKMRNELLAKLISKIDKKLTSYVDEDRFYDLLKSTII